MPPAFEGSHFEVTSPGGLVPGITQLNLPPLKAYAGGDGYATQFLVRPNPRQVFWARPYGGVPKPWARYDLDSGAFRAVQGRAGLHGEIRDAVLDPDGRHAWALLTGGLARLDLDEMREVAVLRAGFPKYLSRLFDLGQGLLAASGWTGATVTIVDGVHMRVVKTLRMPSPQAALSIDGGRSVDLLSFNGQIARSLDLASLKLGPVRPLPVGDGAFIGPSSGWIVRGERQVWDLAPKARLITATRIAEVDLPAGTVQREGPPLADAFKVLGLDTSGRPLILRRHGLVLLDATSLEPVYGLTTGVGTMGPAALLSDGRSAITIPNWDHHERVFLVRW
jgi:hypothetical protein